MKHKDEILVPMTVEQHRYYLETYNQTEQLKEELENYKEWSRKDSIKIGTLENKIKGLEKICKEQFNLKFDIKIILKDSPYIYRFRENPFIEVKVDSMGIVGMHRFIEDVIKTEQDGNYFSRYNYQCIDLHYQSFTDEINKGLGKNLYNKLIEIDSGIKNIYQKEYSNSSEKLNKIPKWIRKIFIKE